MQALDVSGIYVSPLDVTIIVGYLIFIVIAGIVVSRRASEDVDSYFLAGRKMPWWVLGLSGTACYFDVAGVMWTISLFYIMGQKFIWPQFMWGGVVMLACFATFMGKWLRRSRVLTGAEWMVVRFGDGPAGQFARAAYAVMAVVIAVAFIGFAEFGCGRFLEIYTPAGTRGSLAEWFGEHNVQHALAISLMAITGIYTVAAGLFGVGLTGFIQFFIVLLGSFVLIVKAINMSSYEQLAGQVPAEWFRVFPRWEWSRMAEWPDTTGWLLLGPVLLTWLAKGVALGVGGPQQLYDLQRFLAARSPREASLAGMIWSVGLVPMFMVSSAVGVIGIVTWGGQLSNPDQLYPVVIGTMLPIGLKGLVLAGLLSAFMSTFSATVNAGASYLSYDLYFAYVRPNATQRDLVRVSRICSVVIIVAGMVVGMQATNINQIFEWIMMVLGTGVLMPNVLRWFWWRFNGVGFAIGTLVGTVAAIASVVFFPDVKPHVSFPILLGISFAASVLGAFVTPPTDIATLREFYVRIRPAGMWGPVRRSIPADSNDESHDSFGADLLSAVIAAIGLQALFLVSTYACTHQWRACGWAAAVAAVSSVILYFTWYLRLPTAEEGLDSAVESHSTPRKGKKRRSS